MREGYSSCHTLVSGATLYYIRWSNSPSTSNVGLNFSTTSTAICCHIQVGQREFQNLSNGPIAQNSPNSNNPLQSLIGTSQHFSSRTLFYIYRCVVETVKLNFHVKLHATLASNLNSGLCLELQVFCALVSHKI